VAGIVARGRPRSVAIVSLAFATILSFTGGLSVGGANVPRPTEPVVPTGIGAGIYFVAGTADYGFELTQGGNYYLVARADRGSTVEASLTRDGTPVIRESVHLGGMRLVELERGRYALHLEGSGKVALGWDFIFPGIQHFPADQRLVAALAPMAGNRLTISLPFASVPSVHIFAYNDEMNLGLDAVLSSGDSTTFDLPWATSNWVTLVAEPAYGPGEFSLGWTSRQAPVPQNSFLLPLGMIALLIALSSIPAVMIVMRRLRRDA
jgi:hypothetical protein